MRLINNHILVFIHKLFIFIIEYFVTVQIPSGICQLKAKNVSLQV